MKRLTLAQLETLSMLSWERRSAFSMCVPLNTLEALKCRGLVVPIGSFHTQFPRLAPWLITPLGRETLKLHDKELTQ